MQKENKKSRMSDNFLFVVCISRVVLLRQLWIIHYHTKSLSSNLSNVNIKTGVSKEMIFQK